MKVNVIETNPFPKCSKDVYLINEIIDWIFEDLRLDNSQSCSKEIEQFLVEIGKKFKKIDERLNDIHIVVIIIPFKIKSRYNDNNCNGFTFKEKEIYYIIVSEHTDFFHVIGHELSHVAVNVIQPVSKNLSVEQLESLVDSFHQNLLKIKI